MNQAAAESKSGLAIAALVMGILSFLTSFVLIGVVFGILGLVFALVHLGRPFQPRGLAVSGLTLSALGILASLGFGVLYFSAFRNALDAVDHRSTLAGWEGVRAPDFTVTTLDGERLSLEDLRGKRVVVDFWATWCAPCVREMPHFNRLREQTSADELVMLGVSREEPAVIEPFLEEHGIRYPIASTVELPRPYSDVITIPTTFFIDRNGVIQDVVTGYREFDFLEERALAPDHEGPVRSAPEEGDLEDGLEDGSLESADAPRLDPV